LPVNQQHDRHVTLSRPPALISSGRFDHKPGFNAAGADDHVLSLAVLKGTDRLQVWVEASFVDIMGVTDVATHHWFFTADFTLFCHCRFPFNRILSLAL